MCMGSGALRRGKNAVLSGKQSTNRNAVLLGKIPPTCVVLCRNNKMHIAGLNDQ